MCQCRVHSLFLPLPRGPKNPPPKNIVIFVFMIQHDCLYLFLHFYHSNCWQQNAAVMLSLTNAQAEMCHSSSIKHHHRVFSISYKSCCRWSVSPVLLHFSTSAWRWMRRERTHTHDLYFPFPHTEIFVNAKSLRVGVHLWLTLRNAQSC